jgi:UDP-N-acetylglucosamine acyltransferase
MAQVHPTAIVDKQAQLAEDVQVGPYCLIGPDVRIGSGTRLASHVIIEGRTHIGQANRIGHHCTLGQAPQDLKYRGEQTKLVIADHNDIREHCTLHLGTANGGGSTTLGSHNLLMVGAHIAHDSHVASHCVIANNVMLAGHIVIEDYAVVGGLTGITQYVTIGRYAYIGGLAGVVHDCPPFMVSDGHPARVRSVNFIGLARHGFAADAIDRLKVAYRLLFKRDQADFVRGLHATEQLYPDDPHIRELCRFVTNMSAGPNGRYAETQRIDDKRAAPTR